MTRHVNYGMSRNDRRVEREARRLTKEAKRELRREARHERPKGQGAAVDCPLDAAGQKGATL